MCQLSVGDACTKPRIADTCCRLQDNNFSLMALLFVIVNHVSEVQLQRALRSTDNKKGSSC